MLHALYAFWTFLVKSCLPNALGKTPSLAGTKILNNPPIHQLTQNNLNFFTLQESKLEGQSEVAQGSEAPRESTVVSLVQLPNQV